MNIKSFNALQEKWKSQSFDVDIDKLKQSFYPTKISPFLLSFGNNYSYVIDHHKGEFAYISKSIEKILGYNLAYFKNDGPEFLVNKTHPEDYMQVLTALDKTYELYTSLEVKRKKDFRSTYTCRIKTKGNKFLKILHQNFILEVDSQGNLVYSLGICTDITDYGINNRVHLEIKLVDDNHKLNTLKSNKLETNLYSLFSKREIEILNELARGRNSKEIGQAFGISLHTVNVHRKNMMRKAKVNNVTGLLSFSRNHGML